MEVIEIAFLLLSFCALVSVLAGRPWTTRVARRTTEKEAWGHPLFLEANVVLSLAWAVVFAATAVILWISDSVLVALTIALLNSGLGLISPWLGKRYAAWREPAYQGRG